MWKLSYGVGSVVILVLFGLYFWPQIQNTVSQVEFDIPSLFNYACAEEKTIRAGILGTSAELLLSDGRTLNVEQIMDNEGDEVGYRSEDGRTEFWVRDFGAFLTESGTTTYASCRDTSVTFPTLPEESSTATTSEDAPE